jgi:hypothetical protein
MGLPGPRVSLRTEGPSKVHDSSGLTIGNGIGEKVTIIVNSKELRLKEQRQSGLLRSCGRYILHRVSGLSWS